MRTGERMKYRKPLMLSVVIAGVTLGIAAVQAPHQ
jgi:hypothetical protein